MLRTMSILAVCVLTLFSGTNSFLNAQVARDVPRVEGLAVRRLQNVHIEPQRIESFFTELSLSYDIPIGLEISKNDDEQSNYELEFNGGTLSELLTQFITQHNQYAWEIRDNVVNIFPKYEYRDEILGKLLNVKISRFLIKENTSCWALEESLVATPEVTNFVRTNRISHGGLNFSGSYFPQLGRHFALDVSNMRLKAIVNRVIRESPIAKIWVSKRGREDRTFYLRLNARHEDAPAKM